MAKRQVLSLPGVSEVHNPTPTAVRAGNFVYCLRVTGAEPGTGRFDADPQKQITQFFDNVEALLNQAGGSLNDLTYLRVSLRNAPGEGLANVAHRELLNEEWLRRFPTEDRPTRHTVPVPGMAADRIISAEFTAVLGRI